MLICMHCGKDSADEYNFCEHCHKQIKCTNAECGSIIKLDAPICLMCGKSIVRVEDGKVAQNMYEEDIKHTSDSYESHRRFQVTDAAASSLISLLLGQKSALTQSIPYGDTTPKVPPLPPIMQSIIDEGLVTEAIDDDTDTLTVESQLKLQFARFFEISVQGELTPNISDYAGPTMKAQQERFVLLYIAAYEEVHKDQMPGKDMLVEAARGTGIYDSNFTRYFSRLNSIKHIVHTDNGCKLTTSGRTYLKTITDDIDAGKKGFEYWNKGSKPQRRVSRIAKKDEQQVNQWITLPVDIGKMDVKKLGSIHQAMLSLWLLTKHLTVVKAVKPPLAYLYITKKFSTLAGNRSAFVTALSRSKNEKRFQKNAAGECYLTEKAEKEVEAWVAGKDVPGADE